MDLVDAPRDLFDIGVFVIKTGTMVDRIVISRAH